MYKENVQGSVRLSMLLVVLNEASIKYCAVQSQHMQYQLVFSLQPYINIKDVLIRVFNVKFYTSYSYSNSNIQIGFKSCLLQIQYSVCLEIISCKCKLKKLYSTAILISDIFVKVHRVERIPHKWKDNLIWVMKYNFFEVSLTVKISIINIT